MNEKVQTAARYRIVGSVERTIPAVALSATLALLASACGGPPEPAESATAAVKCSAFVEHYCTRYAECVEGTDEQIAQCQSDVDELLDCNRALAVSDQYSKCWSQISDNECSAIIKAVPVACNDVIFVPSAVADCQQLTSEFCSELFGCGTYNSLAECVDAAGAVLDCAQAVETTSNFSACIAALGQRSCSDVEAGLPSICQGVVLTQ